MADGTQVSVIQVDSVDDPHSPRVPPSGHQGTHQRESKTVGQIKAQFGVVYVPSQVPTGFALDKSLVLANHAITIRYRGNGLSLSIHQDLYRGTPRVKTGHVESVSVNGQHAVLVKGAWVQIINHGRAAPAEWDPDIALELIFQIGEWWMDVMVDRNPAAHGFGKAELIRVAESLAPY